VTDYQKIENVKRVGTLTLLANFWFNVSNWKRIYMVFCDW